MINDETQMEIRKFLKKLGINSQKHLHDYIENNVNSNEISVNIDISVDGQNILKFKDKVKIIK